MAPRWSSGTARTRCQMAPLCHVGLASSRLVRSRSTSSSSGDDTDLCVCPIPYMKRCRANS
eukprot:5403825-Amphidinium_carterae.1